MKCFLLPAVLLAITLTTTALADNSIRQVDWIRQIGGLGPEIIFDLVETPDQRLCATGTFSNSARFGAAEREVVLSAADIQDIYVACFDRQGQLEFAVQLGGGISDQPRAIAALPGGDILVTGYFEKQLALGNDRLVSNGSVDLFLIRMDASGKTVWARRFGGELGDSGNALAVTANGDILLGGSFQGRMTYRVDQSTRKSYSAGDRDAFAFRLNSAGDIKWAQVFGGTGRDEISRIIAGADDSVVVAGTFEREAGLDHGGLTMNARGGSDAFIISLERNGELRWAHQLSGKHREYVSGLAADKENNIFISGNFSGDLTVADSTVLNSAGGTDMFLAGFRGDGRLRWARALGGEAVDESFDVAIDEAGTLMLCGHFQGSIEFESGKPGVMSSGSGNADGILIELDRDGNYLHATTAVGDGVETSFAVTSLINGGVAMAGFFNKEVQVPLSGLDSIKKRGKTDVFLLRMSAHHSTL